jgi:hypothetical protein
VGVALIDRRRLDDDSEMGGEGGVAVEEASDDLAGGVAKTGEEVAVPGERSKISNECGVDGLR